MRFNFERQLAELNDMIVEMCAYVEEAVKDAEKALISKDKDLARNIINRDKVTNRMEKAIESECIQVMMTQQPVAKDFRKLTAILKVITDLERIGDQSQDICEIILMLDDMPIKDDLTTIKNLFTAANDMLKQSIDSFIVSDQELAEEVKQKDDVVDDLFDLARKEVIETIRSDSALAEQSIDILQIAKYLERIGDHAENIAEWAIYTNTGVHVDFNSIS